MVQQQSIVDDETSSIDTEVDISGFNITGWNLLVQPITVEEKTKGGIFLPDKYKDDASYLSNICRVLMVGPTAYTQEKFQGETWCKEGDFVLVPKLVGQKLKLRGVPVTIVACDRVIAKVDDPKTIDPMFNMG